MPVEVLVVEDERNVGSTLTERLDQEGYHCTWVRSIQDALLALKQKKFSIALLDVGLPDGNGLELGRVIRTNSPTTAVVFLTAYGSAENRVEGLEMGAEDYVVKPFHFKELLLRLKNILKRIQDISSSAQAGDWLKIGYSEVNFARFEIRRDQNLQPLTHKECSLLKLLVDAQGGVVSRDFILNSLWSEDQFPSTRTVDNFILKLRKWIEKDPENPLVIRTVRGVGYQLVQGEEKI